MRNFVLLLMAGIFISCDRGADPTPGDRQGDDTTPATAYARRMLFVGGRRAEPTIVVFDHGVLASATAAERTAGLWLLAGDNWRPLMDLTWSDQPIRDPWRPVPHGSFRIMVDDAGEIYALRARTDSGTVRLATLNPIVEWVPDEPRRFSVMTAEWSLEADTVTGFVVDILPGPGSPRPAATPGMAAENGQTSALVSDQPERVELVLTDGGEFRLVANIPASVPGQLWVQRGERIESLDRVEFIRDSFPDEEGWRIDARGGELHGEFRPLGERLDLRGSVGTAPGPREKAEFQAIRGWIETRGDRRSVVGIMRRAPT